MIVWLEITFSIYTFERSCVFLRPEQFSFSSDLIDLFEQISAIHLIWITYDRVHRIRVRLKKFSLVKSDGNTHLMYMIVFFEFKKKICSFYLKNLAFLYGKNSFYLRNDYPIRTKIFH
jgi:hypothetical protein